MKIFVGCGSSEDINKDYFDGCELLLNRLLKKNDLVYGAYNNGIMNIAYKCAKKNGNKIIGVAPRVYESDLNELDINEKILVDNILQRTYKLIKMSDAIIFLPGGIGTINEMFASIDMKRSGEIDKPIIIFNYNHYYDYLIDFLNKLFKEKFSEESIKNCYKVASSIYEVLDYFDC